MDKNWQTIIGLRSELQRCDENNITTASIAMAFICIDSLANLGRPLNKDKVTRSDFKSWVDTYLFTHSDQPYKYRGKDVYAARCAFLHTYGSEASMHKEDADIIMYGYHDGGKHGYDKKINPRLVIIGVKSFVGDVIIAIESFIKDCASDTELRNRVEPRLENVLQSSPIKL